jgi:hypothetical protein
LLKVRRTTGLMIYENAKAQFLLTAIDDHK